MLCSTSIGLFITFATLRLAYLQVLPQRRHNTGSCDGYLPLEEYGSFDKLSSDGFVVHTYNTSSHELTMVRIMNILVVCEISGERRDTVSAFSSVVVFECSGSLCPSTIVTEQFHLDCGTSGSYIPFTLSSGEFRTPASEVIATLNTPLAKQCGVCQNTDTRVLTDPETHCGPCHEDCVGLGLCLGSEAIHCCNYYYEDNCVVSCPNGLTPNSLFDCSKCNGWS